MRIKSIMSTQLVSVQLDDSLAAVKHTFDSSHFHHLLVVENGKLFGVISDRDLLKAISPNIGTAAERPGDAATLNKRVHQIMTRKPFTLSADDTILDAVALLNSKNVSCIPIVDELGKPVGILTWRDILRVMEQKLMQASKANPI